MSSELKKPVRHYYHSSSFKIAVFFTLILSVAAAILAYFVYLANPKNIENITLLSGIIFFLMLSVVGTSFFISVFVVKRINTIAEAAKNIMETGDLSKRIFIDSRWDDLSNLAQVLNELLARIEGLMEGVRRVSDNIAHDLRTPLTRLRNELETLKEKPEAKEEATRLIAEADQLLTTFNALLRIANIETGKRHQKFSTLKLDSLVNDVVELYAPLAEEKGITVMHSLKKIEYSADKDLLFQALANLLDNAIKFTPEGGKVSISLEEGPTITITDSGPGIHEDDNEKVFDRFYRGEESRHTPGSGLGLSLVAAVVELHKGRIALQENSPGLKVTVSF